MRIRRVDKNQKQVVAAIRSVGGEVTHIHTIGKGVADLLVSFRQRWLVLEVKMGAKALLTPDEKVWIAKQRAPVFVVRSPLEAIEILNMTNP